MHDIDLIPADYRALRQGRRWWGWCLAAIALALLATAGARGWLQAAMARDEPQVALLRAQTSQAQTLRKELMALNQREGELQDQLRGLRALRQNPPWQAALEAVDHAHNPQVWLDQMQVLATLPVSPLAPTPGASATVPTAPTYRLEIKGHAADHAALSQFVQALGEQPGLAEVRLTQSGLRQAAGGDVVDFELRAALAHGGPP